MGKQWKQCQTSSPLTNVSSSRASRRKNVSDSLTLIVSRIRNLECFVFCLFSSLTASTITASLAGFCLGDCPRQEADFLISPILVLLSDRAFSFNLILLLPRPYVFVTAPNTWLCE